MKRKSGKVQSDKQPSAKRCESGRGEFEEGEEGGVKGQRSSPI